MERVEQGILFPQAETVTTRLFVEKTLPGSDGAVPEFILLPAGSPGDS
jgi:hypothetical protein